MDRFIELASGNSALRGYDYHLENRVRKLESVGKMQFEGIVSGSEDYNIHLDIDHPRRSTCNCPHANGRRVLCKHLVAAYFKAIPGSAERFIKEFESYQEEEEEYREEIYSRVLRELKRMKKDELITEILCLFEDAPEWVFDRFVKSHGLDDWDW